MNTPESVSFQPGEPPAVAPLARPTSLVSTVRAVAWSFIGVRGNAASGADAAKLNPLVLIGVGIALAASFVVLLIVLVNQIVKV
jgi:Protein of unknown function (DUF2970)